MRKSTLMALAAAAVVLTACGGDGDDSPAVTEAVPASASESTGGFIDYLKRLVAVAPDDLQAVDVSAVTPQTSEFDAPVALD